MIIVTSHHNPDFDAVASIIAAQKLYPDSKAVLTGVPEENVARFLNAFEYIFKFEQESSFNPNDVSLVVVVDSQCLPHSGQFLKLKDHSKYVLHIYDHHPLKKQKNYTPERFIHHSFGATVTLLLQIIIERDINIRPEEATLMLLAIFEETGAFRYVGTTPNDMEAAAMLMRFGADIALVTKYLAGSMDMEHTKVLSQFLDSLECVYIRNFKMYFVSAALNNFLPNISFLLHKIREIENIGILFSLTEMAGKVYLIARSNHRFVDVGTIAQHFGGGGHPTASSAVIRNKPLGQVKEELITYLHKAIKSEYTAREIMSSPVKFITAETTVNEAKQSMVKANFNTLPVLANERLVGIVTRKDLDKALFHQLENSPVKLYMNTNLLVVDTDALLSDIRNIFRENNIGRIPVLNKGKLTGLITRTDLFRVLHSNYLSDDIYSESSEFSQYPFSTISRRQFERCVPSEILAIIDSIGMLADKKDFHVYLVGGFVRDIILGYKNFDIDIVVEGNGVAFAQILADHFKGRCVVHKKFSTAVVTFPDGIKVDVATARLEFYESPGALPTIELASIKQDLARRDFTINAMAIKINRSEFGELIDFFCGQQDAKNKIIRILHNLSFIEDPTRIFRAIRLEQRFGFHMDKNTENLIKNAVKTHLFEKIGYDRIRDELIAILNEPKPLNAIQRMYMFDELKCIDSAFQGKSLKRELFIRIEDTLTWFELSFFKQPIKRWIVYFMGMVARLSYNEIKRICNALRIRKCDTAIIYNTFHHFYRVLHILSRKITKNSFLYRVLRDVPIEGLLYLMAYSNKPKIKENISFYLTHLANMTIEITGKDIRITGLAPSPAYKKILFFLLMEKLDGKIKNKKEELHSLNKWVDAYKKKDIIAS